VDTFAATQSASVLKGRDFSFEMGTLEHFGIAIDQFVIP
jgi:hypothetical protein